MAVADHEGTFCQSRRVGNVKLGDIIAQVVIAVEIPREQARDAKPACPESFEDSVALFFAVADDADEWPAAGF